MESQSLKRYAYISGAVFLFAFLLWHSNSAVGAWVQAGFSVVAIYAAIWLSNVQADRDRKREVDRERTAKLSRLESILAIAEHARLVLHEIATNRADERYVDEAPQRRSEISALEDAKTALDGVPLHDVTPWNVAAAVLALRRAVGDVHNVIGNAPRSVISWSPDRAQVFVVASTCANNACGEMRTVLAEFGQRGDDIRTQIASYQMRNSSELTPARHGQARRAEQDDQLAAQPIHVEFSDATYRDIVTRFGGPQNPTDHPYLGIVYPSDERYRAFYDSHPETMREGLPKPSSAI